MSEAPKVRKSITDLENDYNNGNTKPLEDLMRAWKGIKELPPDDPNSFFMLGGYHGEPFRGGGWGSSTYWGGYCNHGNVLFPTWHRVYLLKLETALQSIPGCKDVMLPFWDETSDESRKNGIPKSLTQATFKLDGATIPNPLISFVFTKEITDNINGDSPNYSKPKGYETVRYPLSGLVGSAADLAATKAHNAKYPHYDQNVTYLNQNVVSWLSSFIIINGAPVQTGVYQKYVNCLDAPNYTLFSNTSSAQQWNWDNGTTIVPLESPHNDIHLSVGGFEVPGADFSPIDGANGDMGENDTAGLDPIFFFHHCFIDRVFWLWQTKHHRTASLDIIDSYPGSNTVDNQGPTPGLAANSWLSLETLLNPFRKSDGTVYTSLDCIDIENQLGYTYGPGSLDELATPALAHEVASTRAVRVSGLNRAVIRGSFLIAAYAKVGGKKLLIGTESVLSRWSVQGCANCQAHLETRASIGLHGLQPSASGPDGYHVEVHTRDGVIASPTLTAHTSGKKAFRIEVR